MTPTEYFTDSDEEDDELVKARTEGYKTGIRDMYDNIEVVAELCNIFPAEDRLTMFLHIIKEI